MMNEARSLPTGSPGQRRARCGVVGAGQAVYTGRGGGATMRWKKKPGQEN